MKIKHIFLYSLIGASSMGITSCNDFLNREPITNVTPGAFFTTDDQVASYLNNYYNAHLVNSQGDALYHTHGWNAGLTNNDANTDNFLRDDGSLTYFAGQWQVSSGQTLSSDYGRIRIWNYFLETVLEKFNSNQISGETDVINHYIGEGYFFRAMVYFNALARIGDLPIITEVLPNEESYLQANSTRAPRNEVARFILKDLDEAISRLKGVGFKNNQRINKQVALLFKSRVALFEGTFEKYHKGSGRVPGDSNWPGGTFDGDIDAEIEFFLTEAMNAASEVADITTLTQNSHKINPEMDEVYGWNPYFEMFSQPTLSNVPEVLLWKEYSSSLNVNHNAPFRLMLGDRGGLTRSMITSYLMSNGLPIYANGSGYRGDTSIDMESENRDERMQLFVWSESNVLNSVSTNNDVSTANELKLWSKANLTTAEIQIRDLTGYRQRKHYTYDEVQLASDQIVGTNACPLFRSAEAMLNYMEAYYVKNGSLDAKAESYWKLLRNRAGVDEDFQKTIDATDLAKEDELNDLAVWSGETMIDATLFNIRRERRSEFMGEGMRWDDLRRWRSWDRLLTKPYVAEGINLWDAAYLEYGNDDKTPPLVADGTSESNISMKEVSKYIRPFQRFKSNNQLYDGYSWMKAYYLSPIGIEELSLAPKLYQNPFWPSNTAGLALE